MQATVNNLIKRRKAVEFCCSSREGRGSRRGKRKRKRKKSAERKRETGAADDATSRPKTPERNVLMQNSHLAVPAAPQVRTHDERVLLAANLGKAS